MNYAILYILTILLVSFLFYSILQKCPGFLLVIVDFLYSILNYQGTHTLTRCCYHTYTILNDDYCAILICYTTLISPLLPKCTMLILLVIRGEKRERGICEYADSKLISISENSDFFN